jgi:7-keto-8-aminopelargonate synthetase-like enzyme
VNEPKYLLEWREQLGAIDNNGLRRTFRTFENGGLPTILDTNGKEYLNLASNNYLGLANDPDVLEAAHRALRHCGLGAGSARLLSGNTAVHRELESELARFTEPKRHSPSPPGTRRAWRCSRRCSAPAIRHTATP